MGISAVTAIDRDPRTPSSGRPQCGGFTLIELMVALALGLLLSAGILTLFNGTSRTNKLQNGLASLQENGRFAATRVETDLRMTGAQYCSNFTGTSPSGTVVPVIPLRSPEVFAPNLGFADSGPDSSGASLTTMNSVDNAGYPSGAPATAAYALSPRYFVQGYSCRTDTDCTSGLPAGLPNQGLDAGDRVPASDVLTVRYQRGSGWPVQSTTCASGAALTLEPQSGDDTVNFSAGDLALVSDCQNVSVLPVAGYAANVLTLDTVLAGSTPTCTNPGNRDMRVFNFSKDFVTVTYYLQLQPDLNPDGRPNANGAVRLVPTLMRRENGVNPPQELVRGVDEMRFLYGVQDVNGATRFLDADQVDASAVSCPAPPPGLSTEPGCLWRAVRVIEARLLVNTVDEVFGLDTISRTYTFDGTTTPTTDATVLPSGLKAGSMLRREFIAYASNRNYNF